MSKFKEILHSKFRYNFPDLVKRNILTSGIPNDNKKYYYVTRLYFGIINNIPNEVTYENLDSIKPQLEQIYQAIYMEVDKDSKYYDSFNSIFIRHDFEMDIFTDYATEIKYLKIKLRVQFIDTLNFVATVMYHPQNED